MCVSLQTGCLIFSKMCDSISVKVELTEDDIPGASLGIRKPHELKVPELKRWLACRGATRNGNKAALIERDYKLEVVLLSGSLTQIVGFILKRRKGVWLLLEVRAPVSNHQKLQ